MMHTVEIELSDLRRGVYESLSLAVSRHPSESLPYLVCRVLAFALEYEDGIRLSKGGLSDPDEPARSIEDLTGRRTAWIEVGLPAAERLHRAAKATDRVSVWPHRPTEPWLRQLAGTKIHRAAQIEVHVVDQALIEGLAAALGRRTRLALTASEDELYIELDGVSSGGTLTRQPLLCGQA